MKRNFIIPVSLALMAMFTACDNGNNEFPDFEYQTVYFANQYAMRTIELGTDEFVDLTADNKHETSIKASWGGGYSNNKNILIDYVIDPSLVDDFYFKDTDQLVTVMPSDYYTIEDKQLNIPSGQSMGGVKVKLTDKFFADKKSVGQCYVIPVRMTSATGVDSILSGKPLELNPVLTNSTHWSVQPKNFILYGVKFVNPWHGEYLRRGVDNAKIDGQSSKIIRHSEYVEDDEVAQVNTSAFMEDILPIKVKDANGKDHSVNLQLTFSDDNTCVLSSASADATVNGSGKFVSKGEKKSLGGKDRDAIYLEYTLELPGKNMKFESRDTLVLRTRNVYGAQTFAIERK